MEEPIGYLSPAALPAPLNVDRSVDVAVFDEPAVRAIVNTNAEVFANDLAATGALLGRAARIHEDQFPPGALCLGLDDRRELGPRGVENLFRETASSEALDVELFDSDAIEASYEVERDLVQAVWSTVVRRAAEP